jgi:hypothetical protein
MISRYEMEWNVYAIERGYWRTRHDRYIHTVRSALATVRTYVFCGRSARPQKELGWFHVDGWTHGERELGKVGNVLELSICIPELAGGEKRLEMR